MLKKMQQLQKLIVCLSLVMLFTFSSFRPAFALSIYPVSISTQSYHLGFIQFVIPLIVELLEGAGAAAAAAGAAAAEAAAVSTAATVETITATATAAGVGTAEAVAAGTAVIAEGVTVATEVITSTAEAATVAAVETGTGSSVTGSEAALFAGETAVVSEVEAGIVAIETAEPVAVEMATASKATAPASETVALLRSQSEVTVLTNVAPVMRAELALSEYNVGSGFSGVYNVPTGQWMALPSEGASLRSGRDISRMIIPRRAGHIQVEEELFKTIRAKGLQQNVTPTDNVGFFRL